MHSQLTPIASFLARLLLAFVFLYSGLGKLISPDGSIAYIAKAGLPLPMLAYAGALFVELLVACAFILGFHTRWSAWLLFAFTLATALMFHNNFAEKMQLLQFMKNLAIAGGFLQFALSAPQAWSLDHKIAAARAA